MANGWQDKNYIIAGVKVAYAQYVSRTNDYRLMVMDAFGAFRCRATGLKEDQIQAKYKAIRDREKLVKKSK